MVKHHPGDLASLWSLRAMSADHIQGSGTSASDSQLLSIESHPDPKSSEHTRKDSERATLAIPQPSIPPSDEAQVGGISAE